MQERGVAAHPNISLGLLVLSNWLRAASKKQPPPFCCAISMNLYTISILRDPTLEERSWRLIWFITKPHDALNLVIKRRLPTFAPCPTQTKSTAVKLYVIRVHRDLQMKVVDFTRLMIADTFCIFEPAGSAACSDMFLWWFYISVLAELLRLRYKDV